MCSYNENVDNWIVKLTFVGTTKSLTLIPTWTYLGVWTFKAQTTLNEMNHCPYLSKLHCWLSIMFPLGVMKALHHPSFLRVS